MALETPNLAALLDNTLNSDDTTRRQAEEALRQYREANFPALLHGLATLVADDASSSRVRCAGCMMVKNAVRPAAHDAQLPAAEKWLVLDPALRAMVKTALLRSLATAPPEVRNAASTAISNLAAVELPHAQWGDCVPTLLSLVSTPPAAGSRGSALKTLGQIFEDVNPDHLTSHSGQVLTAVVAVVRATDASTDERVSALSALNHSLEFIRANWALEAQRNMLMTVLCEAAASPVPEVRHGAMECLASVAALYYDTLLPYMQTIAQLTLRCAAEDQSEPASQALEVWVTIAEVELDAAEAAAEAGEGAPPPTCHNLVRTASSALVPLLCTALARRDPGDEDLAPDDVPLRNSALACLMKVADLLRDAVMPHVMPYIEAGVQSPSWQLREAACAAFAAVMDGPTPEEMARLCSAALKVVCDLCRDPVEHVRYVAVWCIYRMVLSHPEGAFATPASIEWVLTSLCAGLADSINVAQQAAGTLRKLAVHVEDSSANSAGGRDALISTSVLSRFFAPVVQSLLTALDRDQLYLQTLVMEAISAHISAAAADVIPQVEGLAEVLLGRLDRLLQAAPQGGAASASMSQAQGQLCAALSLITRKLSQARSARLAVMAPVLMDRFTRVMSMAVAATGTTVEECFTAVGVLAQLMGDSFVPHVPPMVQYACPAIAMHTATSICQAGIGLISDLYGLPSLAAAALPYTDTVVMRLLEVLRSTEASRDLKPLVLEALGDIAMGVGPDFVKYLPSVMTLVEAAGQVAIQATDDEASADFANVLRENVAACYTSILQGSRPPNAPNTAMIPYLPGLVAFATSAWGCARRDERVGQLVLTLLGDLAASCGPLAGPTLMSPQVVAVLSSGMASPLPALQQQAQWAVSVIRSHIPSA